MQLTQHLPFDAPAERYAVQAQHLLDTHAASDSIAAQFLRHTLPRFLHPVVSWQPLPLTDAQILAERLTLDDAKLAVARSYSFLDWASLTAHADAMQLPDSAAARFERAAEAVITGDMATLRRLLAADPLLVHARSARITCHDPAVHGATLLHYVGANGFETYRQRSPANAADVARLLLDLGADPNARAAMYGGMHATLGMLVSSSVPRQAGVHLVLTRLLAERGARLDSDGGGTWNHPLFAALVFGYLDVAELLVELGASPETLAYAAGLGRTEDVRRMLAAVSADELRAALALAVQNQHLAVVALLLDAGADPNRFNPPHMHDHQTPLHGAALAGNLPLVQLLVHAGARVNVVDPMWQATPAGWARHGGHDAVATWLEARAT